MRFLTWLDGLKLDSSRRRTKRAQPHGLCRKLAEVQLSVETLEDRCLPTFFGPVNYAAGLAPQAVVTADFNGGGSDIAVANFSSNTVSVLLGDGLGGFGTKTDFATGANPRSLVVGDVSGDGKLDLITANAADVSILRGNGTGSFAPRDSIALPGQFPPGYTGTDPLAQSPQSVATGDFNGDGRLDLAVTGVTSFLQSYTGFYGYTYYSQVDNAYVNVLLSDGSGGFNPAVTTPLSGLYPNALVAGRFDADARDDVALANTYYNTVSVLLSDGGGGFSSSADFDTGFYSYALTAGDVNGDLKTDLVTANFSANNVSVLLGNGAGGFAAAQNYAVGSEPTFVVLGDFNHDTKLDIAATNSSGNGVSVLLGRGNGTFSLPVNSTSPGAYSIAAGDFNGDGWLDAVTANPSGNNVSVLINDHSWPSLDAPSVSINDVTVTEGNTGSSNATFTVTLSAATNQDVTVHYETANDSATAGSDYTARSGDVTVPAGSTTQTFTVVVLGDRLAEPNETFVVNLGQPARAFLGDSQGQGTILDDEPRISINDTAITEGNTGTRPATFTVNLSAAYDLPVTISYATANGSATAASDYKSASGTLTIPAGQTSASFTVLVNGDKTGEPNETFLVNLSNPGNAAIADGQGVGTIVDDEPRVSINDVTRAEGNKGQTLFTFTVTLSAPSDQTVTLSFHTVNGTATTSNKDYNAKKGTLTFKPGETTKTITITVIGDRYVGDDETFFVDLFGLSSNAQFSKSRGIGTILNDD